MLRAESRRLAMVNKATSIVCLEFSKALIKNGWVEEDRWM